MGRIRSIKPEFFTSPDTAKASPKARLLYIAMWCWADDWGVGETNFNALLGFAFPESDEIERKEVQSLCKEVADAFGTEFYDVDGRHYYSIPAWEEHQRTQRRAARKNPPSDHPKATPDLRVCNADAVSVRTQGNSLHSQGEPGEGTGEQGNRGTGEENTCSPAAPSSECDPEVELEPEDDDDVQEAILEPETFQLAVVESPQPDPFEDEFWPAYPRKVGKPAARKKFETLAKKHGAQVIIDGARRYSQDPNLPEQKYIPYPQKWLGEERWNDGPCPPRHVTGSQQRLAEAAQLAQHIANRPRIQNPYRQTGTDR